MNFFTEKVTEGLTTNTSQKYVVIFANVTRFKLVNELFGRSEGDKLLKYIGNALNDTFGNEAVCGHIGADNFVILMENQLYNEEIIELILDKLNDYSIPINISIRFGVYLIDDITMSIDKICDKIGRAHV